jgi:hypothetical protein
MPSTISRRKLIQKFKSLGFEGIPNPHRSKDIHQSLVNEILKQAGINLDDWDNA